MDWLLVALLYDEEPDDVEHEVCPCSGDFTVCGVRRNRWKSALRTRYGLELDLPPCPLCRSVPDCLNCKGVTK